MLRIRVIFCICLCFCGLAKVPKSQQTRNDVPAIPDAPSTTLQKTQSWSAFKFVYPPAGQYMPKYHTQNFSLLPWQQISAKKDPWVLCGGMVTAEKHHVRFNPWLLTNPVNACSARPRTQQ